MLEDERVYKITGKAAKKTLQVGLLGIAVAGVFLSAVSNSGYFEFGLLGLTLSSSVCAMLLIYIALYSYYGRRL